MESLCRLLCRPPRRDEYDLGVDRFYVSGEDDRIVIRNDFELVNPRGLRLQCSRFSIEENNDPHPCIVYLHGNSGSRLDAFEMLFHVLKQGYQVCCFDFAGCGRSEGDYISLGFHERYDVECVVAYLRNLGSVSDIALWGRSMGAATALLYADMDANISGLVLDSPFADLSELVHEIVKKNKSWIPRFIVSMTLFFLGPAIRSRADFKIDDVKPVEVAARLWIPALFVHGVDDEVIPLHHSMDLCSVYGGHKNFVLVPGLHNDIRPLIWYESALDHLRNCFDGSLEAIRIERLASSSSLSDKNFELGVASLRSSGAANNVFVPVEEPPHVLVPSSSRRSSLVESVLE